MPSQDTIPDFPVQDGVRFALAPSFQGYAASDDGRIWTCRVRGHTHGFDKCWRLMAQNDNSRGYFAVSIHRNRRQETVPAQWLVADAFIGVRPEGYDCCHNNGNRKDNRVSNLRYDTRKGNLADMVIHGTSPRGERQGQAKLTANKVTQIRQRYKPRCSVNGASALAREFGVSRRGIRLIVNGVNWKHLAHPPTFVNCVTNSAAVFGASPSK